MYTSLFCRLRAGPADATLGEVTSFGTDVLGVLDQTFSAKWITDVNARRECPW